MSLFSFIKDAGEKLLGHDHADTTPQASETLAQKLTERLQQLGLGVQNPQVKVEGDKATVSGTTTSQEILEKAVLAIGNTLGIAQVQSNLTTPTSAMGNSPSVSSSMQANAQSQQNTAEGTTSPAQSPSEQPSRFYTVKPGDNLSHISKEMYGSANHTDTIFHANQPMLSSPDKIYPGQSLRIPNLPQTANQNNSQAA